MTVATRYPNAPITEAIIDLRVTLQEGIDVARLKLQCDDVLASYPKQEELIRAVGQMVVAPHGGTASVQQSPLGWKFTSIDQKQVLQSRENGFAFSRLAPYDSWGPFRDEARRLWELYRGTVEPISVTRVAVRYINRIDIPGESVDLKEYFRTSPEISPELPQHLDGYFMQLRMPYPDISSQCVINQTIAPSSKDNVVSVILDIDLFCVKDVPLEEVGIWERFEGLHAAKNKIFESCITDNTRSLFT